MPRKPVKPVPRSFTGRSRTKAAKVPALSPEHRAIGKAVAAALRQDGWENSDTGMGVAGRDRTRALTFCQRPSLSYETLSALFHGDDLAFKVCSLKPETAMRQGCTFTRKAKPVKVPVKPPAPASVMGAATPNPTGEGPGDKPPPEAREDAEPILGKAASDAGLEDQDAETEAQGDDPEDVQEQAKALRKALADLGVFQAFYQAATFGRAFGGAALILGLPGSPSSPAPDDAAELKFITLVDRSELQPVEWYEDPLAPKFGRAKTYAITPKGAGGQVKRPSGPQRTIHESRLILFGGALTTRQVRQQNGGWDQSVIQRCMDALEWLNTTLQSTSYMVSDVSQSVLQTPDLIGAIGQLGIDAVMERVALLDRTRSVARTLLIDKEETFSHQERGALSFLADVIDRFFLRFASAADTPVTLLFRQSPAGMDATGASDIRLWYDTVQTYRTEDLEPQLRRIVQVVSMGLFPDVDPAEWEVQWPPLWQTTPAEQAEYEGAIATKDKTYIDAGVVMPEEVTQTRFGSGKFDPGPYKIDLKARAESLKSDQEAMAGLAGAPGQEPQEGSDGKPAGKPGDGTPAKVPAPPPDDLT